MRKPEFRAPLPGEESKTQERREYLESGRLHFEFHDRPDGKRTIFLQFVRPGNPKHNVMRLGRCSIVGLTQLIVGPPVGRNLKEETINNVSITFHPISEESLIEFFSTASAEQGGVKQAIAYFVQALQEIKHEINEADYEMLKSALRKTLDQIKSNE